MSYFDENKVLVIAEICENHLGDTEMARRMIDEAADARADIAHFQSYRGADVAEDDLEPECLNQVELSNEMHHQLKDHAESQGIEFLSSPFTLERAKLLCEDLGLSKIKIAFSEMSNFPLHDYVNQHADTVFLSTCLADLNEIRQSISLLNKVNNCYILHCCTQYSALDNHANLQAIRLKQMVFPGYSIGYSDHTIGIDGAVAMGAKVVEKPITLETNCAGTDHILSAIPPDLNEMIIRIRRTAFLLGDTVKQPQPAEMEIREFVRNGFAKSP